MGISSINFLYANIGRGHPFYLDGIVGTLDRRAVGTVTDVFEISSGISLFGWRLARWMYRRMSSSGGSGSLYTQLRRRGDYGRPGLLLNIMGRMIRRRFLDDREPLVVGHPSLAGILKGKENLVYQHGELTAPGESLVKGAHAVLVPLSSTADLFLEAGFDRRKIFLSGLCIECALVAQAETAFERRIRCLAGGGPLTGAFFSSGAEPRQHVRKLAAAALSAVLADGAAIVFAQRSGPYAKLVSRLFEENRIEFAAVDSADNVPRSLPRGVLCLYESRPELDRLTSGLFRRFDYFVAPAHERTNWAFGLGLPMFVVGPPVGTFAPLNEVMLAAHGVAEPVVSCGDASGFGDLLQRMRRDGKLEQMAGACWNRFDRRGFINIADFLMREF